MTAVEEDIYFGMYLGSHEVGAWYLEGGLPAHTESTHEFVAPIPGGIPAGNYDLSVWIDPQDLVDEGGGPSAANSVQFSAFELDAPSDWTCDSSFYDAKVNLAKV